MSAKGAQARERSNVIVWRTARQASRGAPFVARRLGAPRGVVSLPPLAPFPVGPKSGRALVVLRSLALFHLPACCLRAQTGRQAGHVPSACDTRARAPVQVRDCDELAEHSAQWIIALIRRQLFSGPNSTSASASASALSCCLARAQSKRIFIRTQWQHFAGCLGARSERAFSSPRWSRDESKAQFQMYRASFGPKRKGRREFGEKHWPAAARASGWGRPKAGPLADAFRDAPLRRVALATERQRGHSHYGFHRPRKPDIQFHLAASWRAGWGEDMIARRGQRRAGRAFFGRHRIRPFIHSFIHLI